MGTNDDDREKELLAQLAAEWERTAPAIRDLAEKLARESPRGMILIAGAYAERDVETLLRAALVKADDASDQLMRGGMSPLGSFNARIKACWCLGLLPEDEYKNLEQIRHLRNYVAHNLESIEFTDQKIKAHLDSLVVEDLGTDKPEALLSYVVGTLGSWVRLAVPLIKTHLLPGLLAHAAAQAVATSRKRPAPIFDDMKELEAIQKRKGNGSTD